MAMTLGTQMAYARSVIRKIREQVTPFNKTDSVSSLARSAALYIPSMALQHIARAADDYIYKSNAEEMDRLAAFGEAFGVGNCGEMSALAFRHLQAMKVHPLDWMRLKNADHAFVVINRDAGSTDTDFRAWGQNAFVCDPWSNDVYMARYLKTKMKALLKKGDTETTSMLTDRKRGYEKE